LGVRENPCLATQYQNLWYATHKEQKMKINVAFYIFKEMFRDNIERTPCIPLQVVKVYKAVAHFKAGCHHMNVQAKNYLDQQ
jgi:hypothetical protein